MGGRLLVIQDSTQKYWACDGILRYQVDEATAKSLVSGTAAGAYLGTYPSVLQFGTTPEGMNSWGRDVATLGGTLSDAQVTAIANAAAAAVVARADKPAIVDAVKQALREGTSG